MHAPLAHAGDAFATLVVHALGEPYTPPAPQLSTLEPEQVVWPGAQLPAHAPVVHVWFTHACAVP